MSEVDATIERLRRLHAGAAAGRWESVSVYSDEGETAHMHLVRDEKWLLEWASSKEDADFIAAAYNEMPTLLAEVERLKAQLATIRSAEKERQAESVVRALVRRHTSYAAPQLAEEVVFGVRLVLGIAG